MSHILRSLAVVVLVGAISACAMSPFGTPQEDESPADGADQSSQPDQSAATSPTVPVAATKSASKLASPSWVNPAIASNKLGKVLVLVVYDDEASRSQYEIDLTAALRAHDVDADPRAWDTTLQASSGSSRLKWVVKNKGYNHLLVTRLSALGSDDLQKAGTTQFEIDGGRGKFEEYWGMDAQVNQAGGDGQAQPGMYVETSLFETGDGTLVWRSRSQTANPRYVDSAELLINSVTDRLLADGLL